MANPEPRFENLLALGVKEILVPNSPGPSDPREIYAAVGFALTMWEGLEEELCSLFAAYLGAPHSAVERAYGSIVSAKARVGMLKEVVEGVYGLSCPDAAALHTKAMNRIGALAGRRNEIAHGIVSAPTVNGKGFGYCLLPPRYNSGKTHSIGEYFSRMQAASPHVEWLRFHLALGKYVYTCAEIMRYAEMFNVAKKDIQAMRIHLFVKRVALGAAVGDEAAPVMGPDGH